VFRQSSSNHQLTNLLINSLLLSHYLARIARALKNNKKSRRSREGTAALFIGYPNTSR
jgi:hypothetical protein